MEESKDQYIHGTERHEELLNYGNYGNMLHINSKSLRTLRGLRTLKDTSEA